MKISASDVRVGNLIEHQGKLWRVLKKEHVKPGKGGAFVRSKLKNIRTGQSVDETFRAGERITLVRVEARDYNYLYNDGNTYNINADTVAGAIAGAMKANKLLLLTDVAGILDQNNKLISSLSIKDAKRIINEKYIVGGMKPKINTCINAIDQGGEKATILDGRISHSLILEFFTEHGIGTQIYS